MIKHSADNSRQARWVQTPERSNVFMLGLMRWLSLKLGRRITRPVLHLITVYFLLFAPASRRASRNYLRRALGREPRWRDLYRHIFTFASTIHDRVFLLNHHFDLFEFEVHGVEDLHHLIAAGQGLFMVGAHLGSFEVIRALAHKETNLRVAMVMHEENAKKINSILAAINPQAAHDIIPLGQVDSILQVRKRLDEGYVVGMLADRTRGTDALYPVQVLDDNTHLPAGPFRIAALLNRPVLFMAGLYMGGNRYAIHFDPLADFSTVLPEDRESAATAALHQYASILDLYCRAAPYNWFNFFEFWPSDIARPNRDS